MFFVDLTGILKLTNLTEFCDTPPLIRTLSMPTQLEATNENIVQNHLNIVLLNVF